MSECRDMVGMPAYDVTSVESPSHYKDMPFEVIDMIESMLSPAEFIGYCLGNEIKYRMRAGKKDPNKIVEDIKKAEWYNSKRIKFMELHYANS